MRADTGAGSPPDSPGVEAGVSCEAGIASASLPDESVTDTTSSGAWRGVRGVLAVSEDLMSVEEIS